MASTVEELTGIAAVDPGIEDVVADAARNRGNAPPRTRPWSSTWARSTLRPTASFAS